MTEAQRQQYMLRVLELARQAEGHTHPNPMVGCVVLQGTEVIATGYHKGPGLWHAEREALLLLSVEEARGATLFVNLEPCCHFGRTPPCTDIILEKGISCVYVGMLDPDPRVAGKGVEILRQAGIEVHVGVEEEACRHLNKAYLMARQQSRPFFTLKTACSMDGYTCSAFGESKWITNAESRRKGHEVRAKNDGILVGIGTVLADDPSLNTRLEGVDDGNAIPIVLDSRLRTPLNANVRTAGKRPIIFHSQSSVEQANADCIRIEQDEGGLNLDQLAKILVERGIYSVLLEGGATVHHAFMKKGWIDRIELFQAPIILGEGKKWLSTLPFHLNFAPNFELIEVSSYSSDLHLCYEQRREHV